MRFGHPLKYALHIKDNNAIHRGREAGRFYMNKPDRGPMNSLASGGQGGSDCQYKILAVPLGHPSGS